ncbi:MAG: TerB family tellurite resistance protein [Alphaproteobacteria bacterium]|nr:TerB family tellurite resistance protein [Alphaproteobacteria bacterium]
MNNRIPSPPAAPGGAFDLARIIDITRQPGGFARLNTAQRRQLLAAILAAVIPCDGKVLDVEVEHFLTHIRQRYQFQLGDQKQAMAFLAGGLSEEQLQQAARQLPELLSVEDRVALIGLLWDIALCDHELHPAEEALVYGVADRAGVVRKRVAEEQARAARANGVGGEAAVSEH